MVKNSSIVHQKTYIRKSSIIPGIIIGGCVGMLVGFFHWTGILIIPGLSNVFTVVPFNQILGGTLLGIIIGGLIVGILALYSKGNINAEHVLETSTPEQSTYDYSENVTLEIKQEQLDIAKKWVETGEVKVYRETFTKGKSFTVPIKREELVIERKSLISDTMKDKDVSTEVIRILLSEEQVEFTKHRVSLEDVSIYKEQVEDIKHIEETLKREEPKVKISGSLNVRN